MRKDLKIYKNKEFIYFPIKKGLKDKKNSDLKIINMEFKKQEIASKTYKDIILIPEKLRHELPTSYDVIGDIILIKLSKDLLRYKREIGQALLHLDESTSVMSIMDFKNKITNDKDFSKLFNTMEKFIKNIKPSETDFRFERLKMFTEQLKKLYFFVGKYTYGDIYGLSEKVRIRSDKRI